MRGLPVTEGRFKKRLLTLVLALVAASALSLGVGSIQKVRAQNSEDQYDPQCIDGIPDTDGDGQISPIEAAQAGANATQGEDPCADTGSDEDDQNGEKTVAPSGPLASLPADVSNPEGSDDVVGDGSVIVVEGEFTVDGEASVVLEDADGTQGTFTDGANADISISDGNLEIVCTGDPLDIAGGDGVLNTEGLFIVTSTDISTAEDGGGNDGSNDDGNDGGGDGDSGDSSDGGDEGDGSSDGGDGNGDTGEDSNSGKGDGNGGGDDGTASSIANAITSDFIEVTGANFDALPPEGTPNAVSDTALTDFPTSGGTYGILTTGDATIAGTPDNAEDSGVNDGGGNVRGDTDFDVTVLRMDFEVPEGANCLSLDFRFLSEEFPEFVGDEFNDTFIAELDDSTWTTSSSDINAPDNFAFDPNGDVVSINSTGVADMSEAEAEGTTYDGATQLLQARTQVTPGAHSLYLSILDQGDRIYDSAAFVDNVSLFNGTGAECQQGVQEPEPLPGPPTQPEPKQPEKTDGPVPILPDTGGPALLLPVAGLLLGSGILGLFVAIRRRA